ncbi:MAG: Smr/MutS family protein [Bacilli bacterium]|nr:Smr/MutS family protein [Bacilli bacterium]
MKNNYIDPFNYNIPSLDLHGFDRDMARVCITDFINDNYKMRNEKICIIHGKGSGIIRNVVLEVLKKDKRVLEYKSSYFNMGCTIVWLKFDK